MIIGDFNEFLFQIKNVGDKQRSEALMSNFRLALDNCGLFDLNHKGSWFTWSNRHASSSFTKERIDRVVVNYIWMDIYSATRVESLVS